MTTDTTKAALADKNERNARVQTRYDELMAEGKRGHYETMFRVVREEVDAALLRANAAVVPSDDVQQRLFALLNGAAGDGLIINEIDAADLFCDLFPDHAEQMGEAPSAPVLAEPGDGDDGDITGQAGPLPEHGWDDGIPAKSATAGMTLAQRILHVGGRNNAAGYVEFGSTQAVDALIGHVLRDLPTPQQPAQGGGDAWIDGIFTKYAGSNEHGVPYLRTYREGFGFIVKDILALPPAQPVQPAPQAQGVEGFRAQHGRDSAELRRLCQARDDARRERDIGRAEIAGLNSSASHLSAMVDSQTRLVQKAASIMTALHESATPDNGPEMNAIIPADAFHTFVDGHAEVLQALASGPQITTPPSPVQAAQQGEAMDCPNIAELLNDVRPYVANAYECAFSDEDENARVLAAIDSALAAPQPAARVGCAHHFTFFGDHPVRRCAWCSVPEQSGIPSPQAGGGKTA